MLSYFQTEYIIYHLKWSLFGIREMLLTISLEQCTCLVTFNIHASQA